MNMKKILLAAVLILPLRLVAKELAWYSGGHVGYAVQKVYDPVVSKALDLFSSDMLAVTGKRAEKRADGSVVIFQMDKLNNKEMKSLETFDVPYTKFITRRDAFWMGVRRGKVVIVGSDGRGTAYGILELSRRAGVSPWIWWGDAKPERRQRLTIDDRFETLQSPSVEYRGLSLADTEWSTKVWSRSHTEPRVKGQQLGPGYYHKLFELMLRLRANTLMAAEGEGKSAFHAVKGNREVADSFAIHVDPKVTLTWRDDNYGYLTHGADADPATGGGVYYHLSYGGVPHDYLWLATTQPGLICSELQLAYARNARRAWIAQIHDPKVAAYPLSLFMDMAWNITSASSQNVSAHLEQWLSAQFGESVGKQLLQPMAAFYHLVGVRKPEFMGWGQVASAAGHSTDGIAPIQDTEFSADEFGNELERYIQSYEAVKQQLQRIEYNLPSDLQSAFFAAVKYPVYAAAAMAVKQLQAQEARHIARKENFHRDEDALESAVRSWKAYREIALLTEQYNKQMADGKWLGLMNMAPRNLPVFMAPLLPDQLTADELKQYDTYQPEPTRMELDGCVVKNAYDYTTATEGTTVIDMLGHSMRAVALPKGGSVSYRFFADRGDAVLRTALIPTHPLDGGDLRYAVSVDGGEPIVYSLSEAAQSERWKVNVLRGQSIRSENIRLSQGAHTLTITALDDHILLDQWMIDYDTDRLFYMFPIQPAYAGAR